MLLMVEDDPAVSSALSRAFSFENTPIICAASATEALEAARTQDEVQLSGLLADAGLPEGATAGIDLGGQLRREHEVLPIAIMTGSSDRHVANLAAAIDAVTYFKPLSLADVRTIARRARDYYDRRRPIEERIRELALERGFTVREASIVGSASRGVTRGDYVTTEGITLSTYRTHEARIRNKSGMSIRALATRLRDELSRSTWSRS